MMTYQFRKRVFRVDDPSSLVFPCTADVSFVFQPLQPFGMSPGGGRTTVHSKPAQVKVDLNSGMHSIESSEPLKPLEVVIDAKNLQAKLQGNILVVSTEVESLHFVTELVSGYFHGLPALLNVELADPPYIEKVYGTLGQTAFRWELESTQFPFELTDQTRQEQKIVDTWQRIPVLNEKGNRRLIGALAYFHTACRLSRCGCAPWEFTSEVVLNLAKVIETLFPGPTRNTIESARSGLKTLGYSKETIERDFVPILALRNAVDVGHPSLSVLKREQLETIYKHTESAEGNFRQLLRRVMEDLSAGKLRLKEVDDLHPSKDVLNVIARMAKSEGLA